MFISNLPLMCSENQALEQTRNPVYARHRNVRWVIRSWNYFLLVNITVPLQISVSLPTIYLYSRTGGNHITDKWNQGIPWCIRNMAHPNSAKPSWFIDLNSDHYDGFIRTTPSFSAMADKTFINLGTNKQKVLKFHEILPNLLLINDYKRFSIFQILTVFRDSFLRTYNPMGFLLFHLRNHAHHAW